MYFGVSFNFFDKFPTTEYFFKNYLDDIYFWKLCSFMLAITNHKNKTTGSALIVKIKFSIKKNVECKRHELTKSYIIGLSIAVTTL